MKLFLINLALLSKCLHVCLSRGYRKNSGFAATLEHILNKTISARSLFKQLLVKTIKNHGKLPVLCRKKRPYPDAVIQN